MNFIFTGEATGAGFRLDLKGTNFKDDEKTEIRTCVISLDSSYGSLPDDFCETCIPPACVLGPKKKSFEFSSLKMSRSGLTPLMGLSIVSSVKHSTRVLR